PLSTKLSTFPKQLHPTFALSMCHDRPAVRYVTRKVHGSRTLHIRTAVSGTAYRKPPLERFHVLWGSKRHAPRPSHHFCFSLALVLAVMVIVQVTESGAARA